ncbi:hypothetical protein AB0F17_11400 [Nonomuraea sp. NPDC026600]|uniref:hypothetical protein n=1 Tax=Nonomuraea sp. NPDC026600 TaxID=3155363 RepID=UPI0033C8ED13
MLRHFKGRIGVRAALVLALATAVAGGVAVAPASAGTATQVQICVGSGHDDIQKYDVYGYNQNGDYVFSPKDIFDTRINGRRCGIVPDWWWVGWVSVNFYTSDNELTGTRKCFAGYEFGSTTYCNFD